MELIRRAEWGASASLGPAMTLPATEVWLHHSVTSLTDDPKADMRVIEAVGVKRFGRLSYSFAVHPSGAVLEGAGASVGAHTGGHNSFSFGIAWIGNYELVRPTGIQISRTAELIRWLISQRWLRPGTYPTGGHRDLKATACPGRHAYSQIPSIRALVLDPQEEDPMTPAEREWLDGELAVIRGKVESTFNQVNSRTGMLFNAINALAATVEADQGDGDTDPAELAALVANHLDDDLAAAVLDNLRARLAA